MAILTNKRVLVFEDDFNNIQVYKVALENDGATVKIFVGGGMDEITALLPLDLIIMDLMIPGGMDGFDFYQALQEIEELNNIPTVAISATSDESAFAKAKEMGFAGYISKPIESETFPAQIASIIDGEKVWVTNRPKRRR